MLHIILLILKIIGITLLCILGLIILLTLILLFVPIRYKADIKYNNDFSLKAKSTFLLHLLSISATYPDEKFHLVVKIFGIRIVDNNRPKKERKMNKSGKKNKNDDSADEIITPSENTSPSDSSTDISLPPEEVLDDLNSDKSANDEPVKEKKSIIGKIKSIIEKIRYTIQNIYAKIKKIINNIEYYIDLWHKKQTQAAYKHIKQEIKRLFLHIRPRKLKGYVEFGMDNPETTGKVLGGISMFYALYGNNITIIPNFDEKVIKANLKFKGRIRLVVLLGIGIRLIKDKNLRRLLKLLKQEEN